MTLSAFETRQIAGHLSAADRVLRRHEIVEGLKDEHALTARAYSDPYRPSQGLVAIAEGRNFRQAAPKLHAVSEELERQWGTRPGPGGFYVPVETRTLVTSSDSDGGYLVGSELQFFVDGFHETSLLRALGVSSLPAKADMAGAKVSTNTTAYWLADETTEITAAAPAFGTFSATPKTVGAYCEASRLLYLQMGDAGLQLVNGELAQAVAEAADTALLQGTAADGQPRGLANVSGIGSTAGTSFSRATAALMLKTIEAAKAVRNRSRLAWVMAPAVYELLVKRESGTANGYCIDDNGRMLGYPVFSSASAPADWIALGDWSAVTAVSFAPLELAANPYAASEAAFQAGIIGLRALLSLDFAWTRPQAFCVATSVT